MNLERAIAGFLSRHYEGRLDAVVSGLPDDRGIYGQFIGDGRVFDYYASPWGTLYRWNRTDSDRLNEYVSTWMELHGVWCDSANPYEFLRGVAATRQDAAVVCKKGGIPCGKRCLPKGQKCRQNSESDRLAVRNAASQARQGGGFIKNLGKVALLGAGVAGAGVAAKEAALEVGSQKYAASKGLDKETVKEGMRDLVGGTVGGIKQAIASERLSDDFAKTIESSLNGESVDPKKLKKLLERHKQQKETKIKPLKQLVKGGIKTATGQRYFEKALS